MSLESVQIIEVTDFQIRFELVHDLINWLMLTLFNREIYKAITLGLFGYLALMHYYSEAFVWSAGSPLGRYIRFKF